MTREEFRKLQEEEATFPSVAAGGYPWRTFTPSLQAPPPKKPKPKTTKGGVKSKAKRRAKKPASA